MAPHVSALIPDCRYMPGQNDWQSSPLQLDGIGFLVGSGRCGTTILGQVLNAHSKIAVPPEMQFLVSNGHWEGIIEVLQGRDLKSVTAEEIVSFIEERSPYDLDKYCDIHNFMIRASHARDDLGSLLLEVFAFICIPKGKSVIIKQTPWYGQHLDELREVFPDMKVIHLIRDGRDVAMSFARTPWWSRDPRENIARWEREVLRIHEYVVEHPSLCLELRYEDLVADPAPRVRRVLEHMGCSYEEEVFALNRQVDYAHLFRGDFKSIQSESQRDHGPTSQVFFEGSRFAWKQSGESSIPEMTRQVGSTLEYFGYEA